MIRDKTNNVKWAKEVFKTWRDSWTYVDKVKALLIFRDSAVLSSSLNRADIMIRFDWLIDETIGKEDIK